MIETKQVGEKDDEKGQELGDTVYDQSAETVKEQVVGRRGSVREDKAPQQFTNNELMTKVEDLTTINQKLLAKIDNIEKEILGLRNKSDLILLRILDVLDIQELVKDRVLENYKKTDKSEVLDKVVQRISQQIGDCIGDLLELRSGK